jgi:hypothetical protein
MWWRRTGRQSWIRQSVGFLASHGHDGQRDLRGHAHEIWVPPAAWAALPGLESGSGNFFSNQ